MQTLLKTEGRIGLESLHTHIRIPFKIDDEKAEITVNYSYSPKKYTGSDAYQQAYEAFRLSYPADEIILKAVVERELPLNNHITFSLEKDGVLLGTAHRHSPQNVFKIGEKEASYGFYPQKLLPGAYYAVLSVHAILEDVDYSLEVLA